MPAMTKRVNVRANIAVRNINPPIHGTCNDIIMTTGDILKCLCKRAHVEEILPNGTTVTLNMKNYFTDNGAGLFVKKEKQQHVEVKKPEPEKADKAPEVPETPVVKTADENKEDDSVSSSENATSDDWGKTEVAQTLDIEPETKPEEDAAGAAEEKADEEIPTATSGYVAIVSEETGSEAATVTVSASTDEPKPASTKKNTSSKSGTKKSNSSKKK